MRNHPSRRMPAMKETIMRSDRRRTATAWKAVWLVLFLLAPIALSAHVTVGPRESAAGQSERYSVRVPTEGQVATVGLELEIPAGVSVTEVPPAEGATIDLRRDAGRIVAITWTKEIKPRESAVFTFVAQNPAAPGDVAWKAHQRFADGTSADWTGPQGDRRPASSTRIGAGGNGTTKP